MNEYLRQVFRVRLIFQLLPSSYRNIFSISHSFCLFALGGASPKAAQDKQGEGTGDGEDIMIRRREKRYGSTAGRDVLVHTFKQI
jgi:hypothetical protein